MCGSRTPRRLRFGPFRIISRAVIVCSPMGFAASSYAETLSSRSSEQPQEEKPTGHQRENDGRRAKERRAVPPSDGREGRQRSTKSERADRNQKSPTGQLDQQR